MRMEDGNSLIAKGELEKSWRMLTVHVLSNSIFI